MIVPIETRVLFLACKHARALVNGKGKSSPFMLVNCTKTFFFSPNFIDIVRQAIREADLGPGLLRLGLEERFAFQNTELALSIIGELKSSGVDFAVEGMGGDSSWINFLRELPENTIVKIDRAFVRHIHTSSSDRDFLFRMLAIFESRGFESPSAASRTRASASCSRGITACSRDSPSRSRASSIGSAFRRTNAATRMSARAIKSALLRR